MVTPLNWGLGHATRCIPVINNILEHNFKVIISANGRSVLDLEQILVKKVEFLG
ncbi:MAG: hypothetical protein HOH98_03325 [Flavobacteriaceae bacterium]|nr:hypothetical protein [Flavobacteriaceae bacterium]MBT7620373.1 hypothetical protein [Flavobacteriales bacterium]